MTAQSIERGSGARQTAPRPIARSLRSVDTRDLDVPTRSEAVAFVRDLSHLRRAQLDDLVRLLDRAVRHEVELIDVLEVGAACEQLRSWLDAAQSALVAAAADRYERECLVELEHDEPDASRSRRRELADQARCAALDEVGLALGWTRGQVRDHARLGVEASTVAGLASTGTSPHGGGRGWAPFVALAAGRCTLRMATQIVDETHDLPEPVVARITETCLVTRPQLFGEDDRPFDLPVSPATFRRRLRRETARQRGAAKDAEVRRGTAVDERRIWLDPHPDGVAQLSVIGETARVTAAARRVDQIARGLRAGGDARTLVQLRSDVTLDLLLYGGGPSQPADDAGARLARGPRTIDASPAEVIRDTDGEAGRSAGTSLAAHQSATCTPAAELIRDTDGGAGPADGARRAGDSRTTSTSVAELASDGESSTPDWLLGELPSAHVALTVSLETLLGGDQPGEIAALPGVFGESIHVTASEARAIACAEGSVWRRIVTDPAGRAIDAVRTYRPTSGMARQVRARDNGCRAPGCGDSSTGAVLLDAGGHDLDHGSDTRRACPDCRTSTAGATTTRPVVTGVPNTSRPPKATSCGGRCPPDAGTRPSRPPTTAMTQCPTTSGRASTRRRAA